MFSIISSVERQPHCFWICCSKLCTMSPLSVLSQGPICPNSTITCFWRSALHLLLCFSENNCPPKSFSDSSGVSHGAQFTSHPPSTSSPLSVRLCLNAGHYHPSVMSHPFQLLHFVVEKCHQVVWILIVLLHVSLSPHGTAVSGGCAFVFISEK